MKKLLILLFLVMPFYVSSATIEETLTGEYEADIVSLKEELRQIRKDQDADQLNGEDPSYYNDIANSTLTSETSGDIQYYDGSQWNRLAKGTAGQILQTGTPPSWVTPESFSLEMKTGEFTGDGQATKAITGVGFQPKYLRIWVQVTAYMEVYEKTDQDSTYAAGDGAYLEDVIISLDADGFTVGDTAGMNTNNYVYTYVAYTY